MEVHQFLAGWAYEAIVMFHVISYEMGFMGFDRFSEGVGQFAPGYQVNICLESHYWKRKWKELKKLIETRRWVWKNLLFYNDQCVDRSQKEQHNDPSCEYPFGSSIFFFFGTFYSHKFDYIFEYIDKCIENIGPEKLVM